MADPHRSGVAVDGLHGAWFSRYHQQMTDTLRLAIAQLDLHVGAIDHNIARIRAARAEGQRLGADLVVTPELGIAGYPPED